MWKKDEVSEQTPEAQTEEAEIERPATATTGTDRATIGRSIKIHGDVTGDENLMIEGRVEGSVNLKQHSVTVGPEGEVKASIVGRVVTVEGKVEGNLSAEEQIVLRSSGWVQGDVAAPRLVLEDGARFRGGVDMGDLAERSGKAAESAPLRQPKRRSQPEKEPAQLTEISSENGKSESDTGIEVTT